MDEIKQSLIQLTEIFEGRLPKDQLNDMRELVVVGEPEVCFENLCTQLFEYDVQLSQDILHTLRRLGVAMGIKSKYWERLGKAPE